MRIHELGHVVLYVTDVEMMATFYRDILGFKQTAGNKGMALFSSGRTHHELLLIEIGGVPREKHYPEPGLYHIGFKIGNSKEEIKEAYDHLKKNRVRILGTTDHGVTHSIYILDPDGNELELYADMDDSWRKDPMKILAPHKQLNYLEY